MKSISKILLAYILIYKLEKISTFTDSEFVEPSSAFYAKKPITLNIYNHMTTSQIEYTNDPDTNTHIFVPKDGYELWEVEFEGPQLREFGEKNTWRSENSSTTAVKVVQKATEDKDAHVDIYLKNGNSISFFTYTVNEQKYNQRYLLKTTTIHQKSKTNNGYKIVSVNRSIVQSCDVHRNFLIMVCVVCSLPVLAMILIIISRKKSRPNQRYTSVGTNEDN
ncbi:hypothetical protein MACJ_001235 [Theileria orientalis]|uniref:Uncharacterized protein n=1 Tax=Theileria orientalis TaxID=68886 RepID=A0A976M7U2_THEOR|nr:hypothetical protein MACJ_001235 [Theileria orientalis]